MAICRSPLRPRIHASAQASRKSRDLRPRTADGSPAWNVRALTHDVLTSTKRESRKSARLTDSRPTLRVLRELRKRGPCLRDARLLSRNARSACEYQVADIPVALSRRFTCASTISGESRGRSQICSPSLPVAEQARRPRCLCSRSWQSSYTPTYTKRPIERNSSHLGRRERQRAREFRPISSRHVVDSPTGA